MKEDRTGFKGHKKFKKEHNAQFEKLTAGFDEHHKGQINRNKHRQPLKPLKKEK